MCAKRRTALASEVGGEWLVREVHRGGQLLKGGDLRRETSEALSCHDWYDFGGGFTVEDICQGQQISDECVGRHVAITRGRGSEANRVSRLRKKIAVARKATHDHNGYPL